MLIFLCQVSDAFEVFLSANARRKPQEESKKNLGTQNSRRTTQEHNSPKISQDLTETNLAVLPQTAWRNVSLEDAARLYFGALPDTMLSLFMSISGGVSWELVIRPLGAINILWVVVYLFYVAWRLRRLSPEGGHKGFWVGYFLFLERLFVGECGRTASS